MTHIYVLVNFLKTWDVKMYVLDDARIKLKNKKLNFKKIWDLVKMGIDHARIKLKNKKLIS